MSPAELKLLVLNSSIKNWPIQLGLGFMVLLTGALGMILLFFDFQTAIVVAAVGMAMTVWPALVSANTEYTLTNLRVTAHSGVFVKSTLEMQIQDVREVRILQNGLQQALGVGNLELVGDKGVFKMVGVEEPETVRDKIVSLK